MACDIPCRWATAVEMDPLAWIMLLDLAVDSTAPDGVVAQRAALPVAMGGHSLVQSGILKACTPCTECLALRCVSRLAVDKLEPRGVLAWRVPTQRHQQKWIL